MLPNPSPYRFGTAADLTSWPPTNGGAPEYA